MFKKYPPQFWLMLLGLIISTTGTTMVWPFLTIFASERLSLPMTAVTSLMSINSLSGLTASILAGSLVDRFGRKSVMAVGLFGTAVAYLGYIYAGSYWHFAVLMLTSGLFNPLYRLGSDAILADMLSPADRVQGYSIFRMARNIGVALGPILGGIVLSSNYNIGFMGASAALTFYGLITLFFLRETLVRDPNAKHENLKEQIQVYCQALTNKPFAHMVGAFTLMEICAALMWVLLAVYVKQNFGIAEATYSWLPTTNALMVVFLQVFITRIIKRYRDTQVMPIGALFYAVAMMIVGLSSQFWGFWLAMVVMTIGELITAPTATTFVANLAPQDQRGRYLGVFGLTWHVAMAIGPFAAGILTDAFGIRSPWFVSVLVGLLSVYAFVLLDRRRKRSGLTS
ncbi:MAG TPA: MFS transporter [Anaerolineaceae bacterium]|nr:MFS transporter [Anaerolineaceae bacterium]